MQVCRSCTSLRVGATLPDVRAKESVEASLVDTHLETFGAVVDVSDLDVDVSDSGVDLVELELDFSLLNVEISLPRAVKELSYCLIEAAVLPGVDFVTLKVGTSLRAPASLWESSALL